MELAKIAKSVNGIGDAFEQFVGANDQRLKGLEESVDGQTEALGALLDRLEEVEAKGAERSFSPKVKGPQAEHRKAFEDWLRTPVDPERQMALKDAERKAGSVVTSVDSQGGFAVPEEIDRMIEKLELEFSPVRRICRVVRASTSDFKQLVSVRGATSGWAGETDTRNQTEAPNLRERAPTSGELYAYPWATNWSLDDVFFDVGDWLSEEVADAFAEALGSAVISGNGSNKPTGMLNTQPVLTDDHSSPLRDADAYEYFAHDASTALSPPSGTAQIVADELFTMVYGLNSRYRQNAVWVMNSNTVAAVRKLKDDQNRYLWTDGLQGGQPNRLLGYPVEVWEDMPDIALNAFPIAFGDFRRGYLIVDIHGTRILRDEVTKPGYTKFYVRRRVGGIILNNDAVKFGRTIG